ncbi:TetR/AcrR family transcriptional regulator [Agromyces sp. SYSU T00194]|uniref:TetR/AcrR family transcriptional regulator n=1 Tax=Agromyces chitinivorans TaxID=3158560 RepID=UPI0033991BF3
MADQVAATSRRRGPYAKTKATRAAILDAALDVFARGGFRSGSIRDIAAAVGMSEAGLLHHFPNKSALLAAVLEHRDERSLEVLGEDDADPRASLRGLVELARYNASVPGVVALYCTLSAEATDPGHPAHEYFVTRYADTVGRLERAFDGCRELGRLRSGTSPASAARQVVAVMDGLQVQWLLDPDGVDMAAELRAFLDEVVDLSD